MEMLLQFGYFVQLEPSVWFLHGLLMMVLGVWLAFNLEKPEK